MFLTVPHCRLQGVGQDMKYIYLYLWHSLFQVQWDRCYQQNDWGRLRINFYNKKDDFNIPIVNFPFICSTILAAPAYGVYISQMIRYSRVCGSYTDVLDRGCCYKAKVRVTRIPLKTGVNSGVPEGPAYPAPLVVPVALI
jgi:hypothetical protein